MKVKHLLLSALISFLFTNTKAQEKHYDVIKDEICECLSKLNSKEVGFPQVQSCIQTAIINNQQLVVREVLSKYPDSLSYERGYEYGQVLGKRLDTSLVYTCASYFHLVDEVRYRWRDAYNKDSIKTVLEGLERQTGSVGKAFFVNRAMLNFIVGNNQKAYADAEEVLKADPINQFALVIKGSVFETENRFEEAIATYYKLVEDTGQRNFLVWAAIARRKMQSKN